MTVPKLLLRRTLVPATLGICMLSLVLILHFVQERSILSASNQLQSDFAASISKTTVHPKQSVVVYGLPVRLKIPKINVDAALDYVGTTLQGALGVPGSPTNAAWYDQGPRPGEKGNAVIDGHFGYKNHTPAVFDNLHSLQKGDNLYVLDAHGAMTTFVVRELRTYNQNQDDVTVFVASDQGAHLNLVTCQGVWNQAQNSFSNRLVVFADKVME
jgi:LPXTG-site transpeptidase (sortase) family protein